MNKSELKVGQTVYLKPTGNAARRGNTKIIPDVVKAIGNKYFELEYKNRYKFSIETGEQHSEYTSDYTVYPSKEAIEEEYELKALNAALRAFPFSLDQLRYLNDKYNLLRR